MFCRSALAPEVEQQLEALGASFLQAFTSIARVDARLQQNGVVQRPPRVHVTTMTFTAKLSGIDQCVDAHLLAEHSTYFDIEPSKFSESSLKLTSVHVPSVSIKLFKNWSVHVTGCKCQVEFACVLMELCALASAAMKTTVTVQSFDLVMVNLNVSMAQGFIITKIAQEVRKRGVFAEQPERPPSCTIKSGSATVMIYKTGKIVFSARTAKAIADMYAFIYDVLETTASESIEPFSETTKKRNSGKYFWAQLVHAAMPGVLHTHVPCTFLFPGCLACLLHGNCFFEQQQQQQHQNQ